MKVLIFGASGYSGRVIMNKALEQNYEVSILVRNKTSITIHHKNITVIEGDVMNRDLISELIKYQDAVIQCLGIGGKGNGKPSTFISDATKLIIEEMEKHGVKRFIVMSNVGAGNSYAFQPWFFNKIILPYFMKWLQVIIDDKNRMEPMIINSKLDWTIVRCPNIITKNSKGTCLATLDGKGLKLSITLGDMASFMIRQLSDKEFLMQAVSISN